MGGNSQWSWLRTGGFDACDGCACLWVIDSPQSSQEISATICRLYCAPMALRRSIPTPICQTVPYSKLFWSESVLPISPSFDDRETEVRPNVLIELGAAIGMRKPYFYFNYAKKRSVIINRKRASITTASDLAGMLYVPYRTYRGLFVELARKLPAFLVDRSLAR